MRETILAQINAARAAGHVCGTEIMAAVPPMRWNDILFSAAARHSLDMVARNYFSHDTPEGVTFTQRLANEGYSFWAAGENIAAGQTTVSGVMGAWLSSDGHCRNIMQPVLNEVAVACVASSSGYGNTWTMDLGGR
ncbi:CAP domain-containing protein [Caenimonas terrae]|uniref:CAP domain-containing protein n=1 Tax=Caenimonas terrae TaxID=696074 RepID=A0ABW0NIC5_9BURK